MSSCFVSPLSIDLYAFQGTGLVPDAAIDTDSGPKIWLRDRHLDCLGLIQMR